MTGRNGSGNVAPLRIHLPCGPEAEFAKRSAGVEQCGEPLADGKPAELPLPFLPVTGKIQKFRMREISIVELGLEDVARIETA